MLMVNSLITAQSKAISKLVNFQLSDSSFWIHSAQSLEALPARQKVCVLVNLIILCFVVDLPCFELFVVWFHCVRWWSACFVTISEFNRLNFHQIHSPDQVSTTDSRASEWTQHLHHWSSHSDLSWQTGGVFGRGIISAVAGAGHTSVYLNMTSAFLIDLILCHIVYTDMRELFQ